MAVSKALPHQPFEQLPVREPGWWGSLALALVLHVGLLVALAFGVQWRQDVPLVHVQAELWAVLPVQPAPPPPAAPPPAPPAVAPEVPAPLPDPQIALSQEKQRQKALAHEKERQHKLQKERQQQRANAAQEKKLEAQAKQRRDELREENLKRMAELAGTATHSAGPSAQYGNRVRDRIKPNVVFTEDVVGNPVAEVQVRTAPDGTIIGRQLVRQSGVLAWDRAVLNAIDKTMILPRDVDGRVPPSLVIVFRPKDYQN
jgi:colicin import membrane protein